MKEPAESLAHRTFEAQAARTPDAPAIRFGERVLSYAELDRAACAVARALRAAGVAPEAPGGEPSVVGLLVERSVEMAIGMLGVLKAGGAYVPLDPAYPTERLEGMLADADAKVLLSQARLLEKLPGQDGRRRLCIEALVAAETSEEGLPSIDFPLGGESLAYVLFTSGTTGRPKGVAVPHRGLANHARSIAKLYELRPDDRVLQFASPSFDVAAEELYPTWVAGGCVVVRDDGLSSSFALLHEFLERERISVLNLPSAYWHEWVAEAERRPVPLPSAVRLVVAGSERALPEALAKWRDLYGTDVRWLNGYGPTETTITATVYEPGENLETGLSAVPIGRAIEGVSCRVVDENGAEVPDGEEGELWIGGLGVARGYVGRDELTAERFQADPQDPGERIYRTGDRVKRLASGDLAFLGRIDGQVKLRGYRIELGEIESALAGLEGVRTAAATLREDRPGERFLAGYYVPEAGASLAARELRSLLSERLPAYMVPSTYTALEALPLTPAGKLDRRALPAPSRDRAGLGLSYVAPKGETEETLCALWQELLGLDQVGTEDSFFELGGHSLLATRLAAEVRERFDATLSPTDVFEAPTIAQLARRVEAAAAAPPEANGVSLEPPPIPKAPRDVDLPVTYQQESVWFLAQMSEGDNLAYNTQISLRLHGRYDHEAMRKALTEVIRRHEVFHTRFSDPDGRPVQRVEQPFEVELPLIDLTHLSPDERQAEAERIVASEVRTPFDLRSVPLVYWKTLKLAEDEHLLVQVEHHFVHDGWSIAILLYEIRECYAAYTAGREPELEPVPVQYADYSAWQRSWLSGEVLEKLLGYWTQKLAGAPPVLDLPLDRPRPPVQTFNGACIQVPLSMELWELIGRRALELGATPYMTMMAAFKALLARYTGNPDVVVATTAANRRRRELEGMIGMVVNTLVLRTTAEGEPTFKEFLGRVRTTALEAFAHQDMPFERLVGALHEKRDFSHNPIFQVMFSFHDAPVPDLDLEDLACTVEYRTNGSAKFDFNIIVIPRAEQRIGRAGSREDQDLLLEWEYNTDLFDGETVERMVRHYLALLRSALENPDAPLSQLSMLSAEEERRVLHEWNASGADFPASRSLPELLSATAEKCADETALVFKDERLTYAELFSRARRLARLLRQRGVQRGTPVGVCLAPGPDQVVALLAALEAGTPYVPLDPAHPPERLAGILEDAGCALTISTAGLALELAMDEPPTLALDLEAEALAALPDTPLEPHEEGPRPTDLAYVIYTSGSTGKPKGVEVEHRSLVNFLCSMAREPGFGTGDTLLSVTTVSFDIAGLELYLPLLVGGTLALAPEAVRADGRALADELERTGATVMQATPATWQLLLSSGWQGKRDLRAFSGGEALPQALSDELLGKVQALWNLYGPTETTIWSAVQELRSGDAPAVGRPIANTELFVLDRAGQLAPVGAPGEIHIGGAGLARGYHERPELTRERFPAHPLRPEERVYATGDRGRWLKDGTIEFLGREDFQVKLRGFRIELGEIESSLRAIEGVEEAVCVLFERSATDRRLVAYLTPAAAPASGELRAALAQRLPGYMVPSHFVALEAFPRTPNGKLDRRALPEPVIEDASAGTGENGERTPVQRAVAEAWCAALGMESVSLRDNFFDLGGHSLVAMEVIANLERTLGVRLTPRQLMLQTLGQLASVCEKRIAEGAAVPAGASADPAPAGGDPAPREGLGRRFLRSLRGLVSPPD